MSSSLSSVNLSVLGFALNSWLDGSAQLRRSLILFPLDLGNTSHDDEPPSPSQQHSSSSGDDEAPARLIDRCMRWFSKPAKDLDEVEKAILGVLDLSSSVILLKLLGSGPILPYILNPLSITLALPRKISVGSVKWPKVVLICFLLSILHDAQRTSVATGLAWLRLKRAARSDAGIGEVVLRGEKLGRKAEDEDEEEEDEPEPCVICSAGQSEAGLSDSISSLASLSTTSQSQTQPNTASADSGPLEAFCVHAPNKHPMHRSCFLAWKDAYWEARASRPIITLMSDDAVVPLPGSWQWQRALSILSALGSRIWHMTYYVPLAPSELSTSAGVDGIGDSIFTLRCLDGVDSGHGGISSEELGTMVSVWPPCPGCRSSVKLIFARARSVRRLGSARAGEGMLSQLLHVWMRSWEQLVSGRTILAKTATQVLFAAFLVSMMRMRKSHARQVLLSRGFSL
ncbi:hypothetical protein ACEPAF_8910 [Sanghuangporus sanghuang]